MNKEEKLKKAILSNYKSIREFARIADIPNTTIVSALDNGIGGMAVDKVLKMCDILHLDVNTFDKSDTKPNNGISPEAYKVATAYDIAETHIQEAIRTLLQLGLSEFNEQQERKNA